MSNIKNFDDDINNLKKQIQNLEQQKENAKVTETNNKLNKLRSGLYEVYFEDKFNHSWFPVKGFGSIPGMNGNNVIDSIEGFMNIANGKDNFVQIGPVVVGDYQEISVQYEPLQGYNNPDAGRGSELVGHHAEVISIMVSSDTKIRLIDQEEDDGGLGF